MQMESGPQMSATSPIQKFCHLWTGILVMLHWFRTLVVRLVWGLAVVCNNFHCFCGIETYVVASRFRCMPLVGNHLWVTFAPRLPFVCDISMVLSVVRGHTFHDRLRCSTSFAITDYRSL